MIPAGEMMGADLFGDRRRIFTKAASNLFEAVSHVREIFNVDTIGRCQVFLITRNIFTMVYFLHLLLSEGEINIAQVYKRVNINCVRISYLVLYLPCEADHLSIVVFG